jgi:hypothetical protein
MGSSQNSADETQAGKALSATDLPFAFTNGSVHYVRIVCLPPQVDDNVVAQQTTYGWFRVVLNDNLIPSL